MYIPIHRYLNVILNVCILVVIKFKFFIKPCPETTPYLTGLGHFLQEKSNYRFSVAGILIKKLAVFLMLAQVFLNEDLEICHASR